MLLPFLKPKRLKPVLKISTPTLAVDVHAHVLPGLDDGPDTLEEALRVVDGLASQGVQKIIATPHIMGNYYRNTSELIENQANVLRQAIRQRAIPITLECAAEYYLDEQMMECLHRKDTLLTFGKANYLLFETPFIQEPSELQEAIQLMVQQGYRPVLAHPERCLYLQRNFDLTREIHKRGVLFQVNINSFMGYYSRQTQLFAEVLTDFQLIDFLATDIHRLNQLELLDMARKQPYFLKNLDNGLLNDTLM
ncbi:MAG: CpsB/CapC family capsule biosynthesis tyrosine phosphatase [Spirosomataceae bacterium]